ncbi:transcriptional regulatory [Pyrenophora seminiperda CCB06]|uniref:Transcriptional regulatory n=1 Tax=Pyrenophora seminiperda CCB06 TaxID=1302712 RepID=A0A3M7LZ18_9PLEO|nr:transcriptional regulatory [Pyrenophora seminiperda CCB06]
MEYDSSSRCLPHNVSYPNYIYNERNAPLALAHDTRANPRCYPVGGPVGSLHSRAPMGHEDSILDNGPARRRIAVACARCRKRKIRCSGDPGTGAGCRNCRSAGVDPMHCQFHRVGSDVPHKVMDNFSLAQSLSNMANPHNMMPIYSTGGSSAMYQRQIPTQQYPQVDTKSAYSSGWTVPCSEDTSPVEAYSLEQQSSYLSTSIPIANASTYGPAYRYYPHVKSSQHGNTYFDQESLTGLPYSTTNIRLAASSDISPLNTSMSALHLSVPERSQQRHFHKSEPNAPQRQLPMPQPSPAQSSRNVVDQMQDARLRSAQAIPGSAVDNRGSFAKPLLPWGAEGDGQLNMSGVSATDGTAQGVVSTQLPDNSESTMGYLPATATIADGQSTADNADQIQLNFSTSSLLEAMSASAPMSTGYSCIRETPTASEMAHQSSHASLYSYNTDRKRHSPGADLSNDCTLVSGHQYTPLGQPRSQNSPSRHNIRRESCQSRHVQQHHASISNLNSTY